MFQASDWVINQNPNQNDYTGIIVGINDPNQNNRAQVRIPFLHNGVPDEFLPWFKNGNIQGNVKGETEIRLPVLNSRVRVTFENDNFYNGTFYDGYKGVQDNDTSFINGEYGKFDGWKDQWGNWYKKYDNGTLIFQNTQGARFEINGTELTISGVTKTTFNCPTNIFNGDVIINNNQHILGDQQVDGTVTFPADNLIVGGKNINSSHGHSGVQSGQSTTGGVV